ncbi:RDD family protein [Gilvimarinus polysaccharolyticus]|uniref:RDD family protein n=1 Tax=Gilvimarinus polysaccharolyticus TaxID=863921 RepID=UPI0009FE7943|nr:RDD family protein [Gilvimarinus polysaccharolyticus]
MSRSKTPTQPTTKKLVVTTAGVLKRLAAGVYDSLLIMALSLAYSAAVLAVNTLLLGDTLAPGEKANMGVLGFIGWVAIWIGFYIVFWQRFGQTLGMKAWRLKLTNADGGKPSIKQCLLRCLFGSLSLALFGLGYFWLWFDSERLTLHDRLSGTRVVQLPKGH